MTFLLAQSFQRKHRGIVVVSLALILLLSSENSDLSKYQHFVIYLSLLKVLTSDSD